MSLKTFILLSLYVVGGTLIQSPTASCLGESCTDDEDSTGLLAVWSRPNVKVHGISANHTAVCETATKTVMPKCYASVKYAMTEGIKKTPKVYAGLREDDLFETVQNYLNCDPLANTSHRLWGCLHPACSPGTPSPTPVVQTPSPTQSPTTPSPTQSPTPVTPSPTVAPSPRPTPGPTAHCQTSTKALMPKCYKEVVWAMQHGIEEHPDNYPGLNEQSSFESFQDYLYNHAAMRQDCDAPACDPVCRTATQDIMSECYKEVMYAMEVGIEQYPSNYPGLNEQSVFEDFQNYLYNHAAMRQDCLRPACAPGPSPVRVNCLVLPKSHPACQTATKTGNLTDCYTEVKMAMDIDAHGLNRYPGLTWNSSFEDFQTCLFNENVGGQNECSVPGCGTQA